MSQSRIIGAAVILLTAALYFSYRDGELSDGGAESQPWSDTRADATGSEPPPTPVPASPVGAEALASKRTSASPQPQSDSSAPAPSLLRVTQDRINELGKCLGVNVAPIDAESEDELGLYTFNQSLLPGLGEIVSQKEQWQAVEIQSPDGEIRKIVTESSPDGPSRRKLTYYKVKEGGRLETIPLAEDQASFPTASLIASLEADGRVLQRSGSTLVFYRNAKLVLEQVDGKINSFEMIKGDKTFRCSKFSDTASSSCSCE